MSCLHDEFVARKCGEYHFNVLSNVHKTTIITYSIEVRACACYLHDIIKFMIRKKCATHFREASKMTSEHICSGIKNCATNFWLVWCGCLHFHSKDVEKEWFCLCYFSSFFFYMESSAPLFELRCSLFEWHVPFKLAKWHSKYSLTTHLFVRESKLLTQDHKYRRNAKEYCNIFNGIMRG